MSIASYKTRKFTSAVAILLGSLLISSHSFAAKNCIETVGDVPWKHVDRPIMMALRSNAPFTLAWLEQNINKYINPKISNIMGYIIGDFHLNNLAPKLLTINGVVQHRANMLLVDFDDARKGRIVSDLFYLSVITRSATDSISTEDVTSYYFKGMNGEGFDLPLAQKLEHSFNLSAEEITAMNHKYTMDRVTVKNQQPSLKHKALGTETIELSPKEVQVAFPAARKQFDRVLHERGYDVLDYGYMAKEEGGSEGLHRFFALVKKGDGIQIFQFKQVEDIDGQIAAERVRAAIEFFWNLPPSTNGRLADDNHEVVETEIGTFFMAIKEKRLYRYENSAKKSLFDDFKAGTLYLLWLRGTYLNRQDGGVKFSQLMEDEATKKAFFTGMADMVDNYLTPTKKSHNSRLKNEKKKVEKEKRKKSRKKKKKKK